MGNRGTTYKKPAKKTPVVGEDFKEKEFERLKESNVKYITSGRGTGKIEFEATKTKKKPKYKGKIHSRTGIQ